MHLLTIKHAQSANLRQGDILFVVKSHISCQNYFWKPNIYRIAAFGYMCIYVKPRWRYYNWKMSSTVRRFWPWNVTLIFQVLTMSPMLSICAKFNEKQICTFQEIITSSINKRTNEPTNCDSWSVGLFDVRISWIVAVIFCTPFVCSPCSVNRNGCAW